VLVETGVTETAIVDLVVETAATVVV